MSDFKKLLVPLDGSRLAEAVLPIVEVVAERFDATVSFLHVLEERAPETVHGEPHLADTREARAYLARVAERYRRRGLKVEEHVHPNKERDVVGSIIGHGEEFGADMVILSTHGWGGMRDLLAGSIAQQVLRRGDLPVLLVKPTATGEAPPFKGRRLLVPLDGSATHDGVVLPVAEQVALGLGAEVRLLVAVPTRGTVPGDQAAIAVLTPNAMKEALEMETEEARRYLGGIVAELRARRIKAAAQVRRGDPATRVAEAAEDTHPDLIVMSTHGRAALDALWAASVGSRVLARIQQPLLLVRVP